MLILSVKSGGKVVITTDSGERIEVVNIDVRNLRLGFAADESVKILRGELEQRMEAA